MAIGFLIEGKFSLYTSSVTLLLVTLSLVLSYSILLTSLASILVASLMAGAGMNVTFQFLKEIVKRRRKMCAQTPSKVDSNLV